MAVPTYWTTSISRSEYDQRLSDADAIFESAAATKNEIKGKFLPSLSADAVLAFAIYMAIALTTFLAGLTLTDPVFEYFLAHRDRSVARSRLFFIEGVASRRQEILEGELEGIQTKIATLEAETIEEDDVSETENVSAIDRSVESLKSDIQRLETEVSAQQNVVREKAKMRSLKYARAFALLKGDRTPIREWEALVDRPDISL